VSRKEVARWGRRGGRGERKRRDQERCVLTISRTEGYVLGTGKQIDTVLKFDLKEKEGGNERKEGKLNTHSNLDEGLPTFELGDIDLLSLENLVQI